MTGTGADSEADKAPAPAVAPAVEPVAAPAPEPSAVPPIPPPWSGQPAVPPSGPPPQWAAPGVPARSRNGGIIAGAVAAVVLLVVCLGVVGRFALTSMSSAAGTGAASSAEPVARSSPGTRTASPGPVDDGEPVQQGPQASQYPAEDVADLDRVCDDNVYYPQSPARAGKGPHPVALLVADGSGLRFQNGTYYFPEGLSKSVEQAWAPKNAGDVRMVACLDRVSTGAKIRDCKFDDPKPDTLPLMRAEWRIKVYEAATGHVLLDKALTGDDQKCPYVVMVRGDRKIYAGVSDKAVISALRKLVKG